MAIPKFLKDLAIISKLGDNPGVDNGLSTSAFRAKFDEGTQEIQKYINDELVPSIPSLDSYKVVLSASAWVGKAQTVKIPTVTANEQLSDVIASVVLEGNDSVANAGVRVVQQLDGAIVFNCEYVPSVDVTVNVLVKS